MTRAWIVFLTLGTLSGTLASAQSAPTPSLTARIVLPPVLLRTSDNTRCLYQDYVGVVWRCTDRGITRFDGRNEVTFATDITDLRAIVRASRGGEYWVGAASGLYRMRSDAGAVRLERFVTQRQVAAVNGLVDFSEGAIGCATDDGAFTLADGKLTEIRFDLPDDRAGRVVHVLLEPDPSALFAGTSSGLYVRYRDGRTRHYTTRDGLPDNDVKALAFTQGGRIWIGTSRGLATIGLKDLRSDSPRPVQVFSDAEALRNADIRALRAMPATEVNSIGAISALWVGASTGLVVIKTPSATGPEFRQLADASIRLLSHGGPDLYVMTDEGDIR